FAAASSPPHPGPQPPLPLGLWTTDGTEAGTQSLVVPLPGVSGAGRLLAIGATAFAAGDAGLWRSDGTPAGTFLLAPVHAQSLMSAGPRLFFAGSDPATGIDLWTSDGTAAGTGLVKDIAPGTQGSLELDPGDLPASIAPIPSADLGGVLLFAANDGTHGVE